MEESVKSRIKKSLDKSKEIDIETNAIYKDDTEKAVYYSVDVIQAFWEEVKRQYPENKALAESFEDVWNYLLGSLEMKDNDPLKYKTSLESGIYFGN